MQMSFFDMMEDDKIRHEQNTSTQHLDVVKMDFIESESLTWQQLFDGFDTIHAITYSSGIGFICNLLDKFSEAEIIFGNDNIMAYGLHEIMAYQSKTIERLREHSGKYKIDLISKIESGKLRLYVARTILSHEKIYLLASKDGRKRVIMGSANMSYTAFSGAQRENICYVDGERAYEWYMDCFHELKEQSTDDISLQAYKISDNIENIEELPIFNSVRAKKALVIETVNNAEDVQFGLDVKNLAKKFNAFTPKADKSGKLILSPEKIKSIRRQVVDNQKTENERRSIHPQLIVDVENGTVELNGERPVLTPPQESIRRDVKLFVQYMSGYEKFHGDIDGIQRRYFEFANWFFCSPFMASMRDMAVRYNQNLLPYPVFGLVYGQSKAGKTSFLETLLKMMIGQKTKISAPDFTRSSIETLKRTVMGAPIIVDDLTQVRFNQHAIETIKNDDFGTSEHMVNYPAVVISANEDVKAVAPEVIRRTVICRVQAGLTNSEVMRSNVVRTVQREIGTSFYLEYMRRMMEIVPNLLEELKSDTSECPPDILHYSSIVIKDIISEHSEFSPSYIRELSLDDYFSEKVTGSYAIKTIQTAWRTSQKSFEISSRANELRYNAGAPYEAERIIKELPETLEAHKSREWVIMNLDAAIEFFEIRFRKKALSYLFAKN